MTNPKDVAAAVERVRRRCAGHRPSSFIEARLEEQRFPEDLETLCAAALRVAELAPLAEHCDDFRTERDQLRAERDRLEHQRVESIERAQRLQAELAAAERDRDEAREAVQQLSAGRPLGEIAADHAARRMIPRIHELEAELAAARGELDTRSDEALCLNRELENWQASAHAWLRERDEARARVAELEGSLQPISSMTGERVVINPMQEASRQAREAFQWKLEPGNTSATEELKAKLARAEEALRPFAELKGTWTRLTTSHEDGKGSVTPGMIRAALAALATSTGERQEVEK